MSSTTDLQVLPAGAGYGIVIGIGGIFAALMLGITYLQNHYTTDSTGQVDEFTTASRSVKPGLVCAGIISSWTWPATLLSSATFAHEYGVGGPLWYRAMVPWNIMLFASLAVKIKDRSPSAHTSPDIIMARRGRVAHATYLFPGLGTNMSVGASLVLGASQVVSASCGMNEYEACFLIRTIVAVYVIARGFRSTFIGDYAHTVIWLLRSSFLGLIFMLRMMSLAGLFYFLE